MNDYIVPSAKPTPLGGAVTDSSNLQFDRAEPAGRESATCANCHQPLTTTYFQINGVAICPRCRALIDAQWNRGTSAGRFARALGLGGLAAIAGAAVYYGILAATGFEFSLISILVGLLVGVAVRKGSYGRGGWRYQALAMFLTYTSIVAAYVPLIVKEFSQRAGSAAAPAAVDSAVRPDAAAPATPTTTDASPGPRPRAMNFALALLLSIGFIYAIPFLGGLENILGIVIIAIGLYEAWKINRAPRREITGPHQLNQPGPATS